MLDDELVEQGVKLIEDTESTDYQFRQIVSLIHWIALRFVDGHKDEERVQE